MIESGLGPAAVVAGAGSGKTETMAARVVWLVANRRVRPDQVLGLTFTRKAAAELGARIRRRLAQWRRVVEHERPDDTEHIAVLQSLEPTVSTYAAYAGRLVGEQALRVGAEPDARLLSPARLWQLADTVVREWDEPLPDFRAISSLVHWIIAMAGQLADHLADPGDVEAFCDDALARFFALPVGKGARSDIPSAARSYLEALRQRRALVPLVRRFQQRKASEGAVDFGDQMRLAAQLAGLPEVAAGERDRFRAVLLDEYQDTGHAQIAMLRGLFGGGHPVTAVGDPFQSIYGWRGRQRGQHGRLRHHLPERRRRARPGAPAGHQLPQRPGDPRRRQRRGRAAADRPGDAAAATARRQRSGAGGGGLPRDRRRRGPLAGRARARGVGRAAGRGADRRGARATALPDGPAGRRAARTPGCRSRSSASAGLLTTPEVVDVVATLRVLGDHQAERGAGPAADRGAVADRPARPRRAARPRPRAGAPARRRRGRPRRGRSR